MSFYHSALAGGYDVDVEPMDRVEFKGSVAFAHDITKGLPSEYDQCDVFYSEPPWPHGMTVFNERAGIDSTYEDIGKSLAVIVEQVERPIYITLGKTLLSKLPVPEVQFPSSLNGNRIIVAAWNAEYEIKDRLTTGLQKKLGIAYNCLGDFCCGYGDPVLTFLRSGGKSFIASDYNAKCVTVIGQRLGVVK